MRTTMIEPTKILTTLLGRAGFVFSLLLFLGAGILDAPAQAQSSDRSVEIAPNVKLTQARGKAKTAKKTYDTVKRLCQRGSASQKQLRDARLLENLAVLELASLVSPEREQRNSLLRAKIIFNYRSKELEIVESLYQRGSAPQLDFQRAKIARDVAQARLKAAQSDSQTQQKIQAINAANSKLQLAQKEHLLASKLLKTGSISQAEMDRARSNLEIAESALTEAKKSLGAKATEVQQ